MYSTCIFCHRSLGSNEVVEHFSIGRRLAFDSAKGRLWVVCPHCARWNLSPLEERWEAVEECERAFRGQPLRAQTQHIGFTKLPEGLSLIRIGAPLKPEFAAWRYGDVFRRRFKRRVAWIGAGVAAAGAGLGVGLATGIAVAPLVVAPPVLFQGANIAWQAARAYRDYLRTTYVPRVGRRPFLVFGANMKETDLEPRQGNAAWLLNLRHVAGTEQLAGDAARRAIGILMTRVNDGGASASTVTGAAELMAAAGGPDQYIARLAIKSRRQTGDFRVRRLRARREGGYEPADRGALPYLGLEERLALEMAVHEEEERRALEEEIGVLESAWRDAEAVAAIADDLLTPPSTRRFIAQRRSDDTR